MDGIRADIVTKDGRYQVNHENKERKGIVGKMDEGGESPRKC